MPVAPSSDATTFARTTPSSSSTTELRPIERTAFRILRTPGPAQVAPFLPATVGRIGGESHRGRQGNAARQPKG